ncbi:Hypothetical predicted protein [Lecanosticta acicola]|uniref:Pcc1-domain-containing protein n=1 Tax=Lecanosticta acicola TaxID=111012 RepID=A0AAI8Z4R2_9PEZI|nr:Hypothetical predicted protein [Lecanosticta acicola]
MTVSAQAVDPEFPCSLTIHIPFPTSRLATAAIRTLSVDQELSPLVQRAFSLVAALPDSTTAVQSNTFKASLIVNAAPNEPIHAPSTTNSANSTGIDTSSDATQTILKTDYKATTNRMLRVAVNGFFESLGTVIQVMEELDTDVLHEKGFESLEGAQGIEEGMTGSTG